MKHKPGLTVPSLYRPLLPTPVFFFNKVRTQLSGLMAPSLDVPPVSVSLWQAYFMFRTVFGARGWPEEVFFFFFFLATCFIHTEAFFLQTRNHPNQVRSDWKLLSPFAQPHTHTHRGPSPTRLLASTVSTANKRKNISEILQSIIWGYANRVHFGLHFCTLVEKKNMCPEFCFVSINLSLRNYWPWIWELQMDSFNKYPVRRQPLCVMGS